MGRFLPTHFRQWTSDKMKDEGVQVLPNRQVQGATFEGNELF